MYEKMEMCFLNITKRGMINEKAKCYNKYYYNSYLYKWYFYYKL